MKNFDLDISELFNPDGCEINGRTANKVLARLSYQHIPARCRKAKYDAFHVYADTVEQARDEVYKQAALLLKTSKGVQFKGRLTFQPAFVESGCRSFIICPTEGQDGCIGEEFCPALA